MLWARTGALGFDVDYEALERGHGGLCEPAAKRVTVNADQAVKRARRRALLLAHVDRHDDDLTLGYAEGELVAESVAHPRVLVRGP